MVRKYEDTMQYTVTVSTQSITHSLSTHLDLSRVRNVGSHAQIDERTALVHSGLGSIRNLIADKVHLLHDDDDTQEYSELNIMTIFSRMGVGTLKGFMANISRAWSFVSTRRYVNKNQ